MPARSDIPVTREERRRRTEAAILDAARQLFAEVGYEKTTIRGVAGRAGVDPALVMQYYGSKDGLFAAAAHAIAERKQVSEVPRDELGLQALKDLFQGFEDEQSRCAHFAVMRSCLTNESARAVMRDEIMAAMADLPPPSDLATAVMSGTTP